MKRFNIFLVLLSLLSDVAAIFLGLILAYQLRAEGGELFAWPYFTYLKLAAAMLPIWLFFFISQGLYNLRNTPRGWSSFSKLITGLLSGWAVMIIVFYFWRSTAAQNFPRLVIIYGIGLTTLFALTGRLLISAVTQLLHKLGIGVIRCLVITTSNSNQFLDALNRERRYGRQIVGSITGDEAADFERLLSHRPDEIIVASGALTEDRLLELLSWAESKNIYVVAVPSLFDLRSTNVETGSLAGKPVMFFRRSPLEGWGRVFKRLLDLVLVVPAIIILSPLLVALFILAQLSTGSGIIAQERIGQDGRRFKIHKFRSMYVDGDERFPQFKGWSSDESQDPRITSVGRLLRKTNLDELAQLFDVLSGTMSLVGPRPEQPKYVEKFAQEIPNYLNRHHVKSGLTGWAQINGLRGNTPITDRVKYDLFYIENWSIWFDIRIIIGTFAYLFRQLKG